MNERVEEICAHISESIERIDMQTHYDLIRWAKKGWLFSHNENIANELTKVCFGAGKTSFLYELNSPEIRKQIFPDRVYIKESLGV